jgi:hypothetical protein
MQTVYKTGFFIRDSVMGRLVERVGRSIWATDAWLSRLREYRIKTKVAVALSLRVRQTER